MPPSEKDKIFCSRKCQNQKRAEKHTEKTCLNCFAKFIVNPSKIDKKFCGNKCVNSYKSNGVTATCVNCKKIFPVSPTRAKRAKFCGKKCQTVKIEKTCQTCGKAYLVVPSFKKSQFCNRFCFQHNKETKKKLRLIAKKLLTPERRQKLIQWLKLSKGSKGHNKLNNPKIAAAAKLRSIKQKNKPLPQLDKWREFSKTPEARKQNSERAKKYYAENPEKHINFILAQKGFETSIEKKMRLALEEKLISFETQFKIGRFWVDFALTDYRLVIEADGEYWHQDKEKDAKRDEIIKSYGWRVIRFSEKQINKDVSWCVSKIQEIIS